ncbi:TIGR03620 family F420-dependent LLM class oxidoreductase [Amycolatopsis sp. NPDC051903]|uniref:TIGR03620 family F420-dependent LLM class oxidoreductase n=1 Tax=Amycolatopsis sp. NPDC051903 TaxID=3363936 RepID=UPI0037BC36AE
MTIALGRYGIWQPAASTTPDQAREIERLGFPTLWAAGAPADLAGVDELLEATSTLVVGTSIVNIWRGDPGVAAAAYHRVSERFPGRFWLGVGAGHREHTPEFRKPLAAMNAYLDALDAGGVPVEGRAIAALGPKMLALTAARAGGAVPYLVPPAHTKLAREALGPAAVLAPEMKVVLDANPVRARDTARPRIANPTLGLVNYTANLRRLSFTDDDLSGGGSDRLIDALVAHGAAATVAARLAEHHAAGADHVAIQVITPRHATHPDLPGVQLQVHDYEVVDVYRTLAAELL